MLPSSGCHLFELARCGHAGSHQARIDCAECLRPVTKLADQDGGAIGLYLPSDPSDRRKHELRRAAADSATENDEIGIKDANDIGNPDTEDGEDGLQRLSCLRIAVAISLKNKVSIAGLCQPFRPGIRARLHELPPERSDTLSGSIAFKISGAAEILIPLRPVHVQELQFTGCPRPSHIESPVDENPGSDPGSERNKYKVFGVPRNPAPVLADGGHVGIVLDADRQAEFPFQFPLEVDVFPPGQIVRHEHKAGAWINGAWHRETHGAKPVSLLFRDQAVNAVLDLVDCFPRAVFRPHFLDGVGDDLAGKIRKRKMEMARAHINTYNIAKVRIEPDAAASRGGDEPGAPKFFDSAIDFRKISGHLFRQRL